MRKKILIFGHYGVPNWGDEAILAGILSQINTTKFSVTVISHNPLLTKQLHYTNAVVPPPFGIRSFFRFNWFSSLKAIQEADYIIIGGGGLWQPRPLKALKLWNFYLQICLFFKRSKTKIFSLGTSFSLLPSHPKTLHNSAYISLLHKTGTLLQKIHFFTVRDEKSKILLTDRYNIHSAKISNTSDAAFFLSPPQKQTQKKTVLLAIREKDVTFEQEKVILTALKNHFKNHTFVVFVMQSYQSHDERFTERHKKSFPTLKTLYPQTLNEVLQEISSASFVCSSRLHANILASLCNTNFLALSCRDKVKNLFTNHLSEHVIEKNIINNSKKSKNILRKKLQHITQNNSNTFLTRNAKFLEIQKKKLQNFFPDILL